MIDVLVLLDEGAQTLAMTRRVQSRAGNLGIATRDLILTYRKHRLRPIAGASSERVASVATPRYLLQAAHGDALCDSCLTFACATSVAEMRVLMSALLDTEPRDFHHAPTCASCGRTVPSIVYK